MPLKKSCVDFPPLATYLRRTKKGSLTSMKSPVTRSRLNLPPLFIYQELKCCDEQDEINQVFLKLSALYRNLQDPLKEMLFRCSCEDQEKCYKFSYFDKFPMNELPQEVYCTPQPDHMPLRKRFFSNKFANEHQAFGVYRKDAPLATVVARWTPNSMSTQYDQQSVIEELAKFGDIESVTPFGRQTVIVIFKEITSACKAVNAFPPNCPERGMQCFWHHKFMSKYKRQKFQTNETSATLAA
ncbi:testis expressed protein 56-like [Elgaria multicarinata webbii]|uniref:testis expressed protein 56-like n=1 Tax=Elgaria multicarinata webbii TaxID=159646 RepID=UPI002FCCDEF7